MFPVCLEQIDEFLEISNFDWLKDYFAPYISLFVIAFNLILAKIVEAARFNPRFLTISLNFYPLGKN